MLVVGHDTANRDVSSGTSNYNIDNIVKHATFLLGFYGANCLTIKVQIAAPTEKKE